METSSTRNLEVDDQPCTTSNDRLIVGADGVVFDSTNHAGSLSLDRVFFGCFFPNMGETPKFHVFHPKQLSVLCRMN